MCFYYKSHADPSQYEGGTASVKHCFNTEIAKDVGINAAVVFENLAYWITHNEKTGRNIKDGAAWMYATQKEIAAQFGYLSVKQTRTALEKLAMGGYIETGCHNKHGYDRTAWYTLTEKGESFCRGGRKGTTKKALRIARKGEPIPDIKPDISPDIESRAEALRRRLTGA